MSLWDRLRRAAFVSACVALAGFAVVILLDEVRSPSWTISLTFAGTCIFAILIGLLCDIAICIRNRMSQELRESTFEWISWPLKAGLLLLPTQHQARYLEEFRSEIFEQPDLSKRENLMYSIRAATSLIALVRVLTKAQKSDLIAGEHYGLINFESVDTVTKDDLLGLSRNSSPFLTTRPVENDDAARLADTSAMSLSSAQRTSKFGISSRFLIWMGGASSGDLGDDHEVAQYKISGFLGFLTAIIALEVTAIAAASVLTVSIWTSMPFAATWAIVIAAVDRSIATRIDFPDRSNFARFLSYSARILTSVIIGVIIAETASLALLKTSVETRLSQEITENTQLAQAAILHNDPYIQHEQQRIEAVYQQASRDLEQAKADVDTAELRLACETAGGRSTSCASVASTGVPGRGQLTRILESSLATLQVSYNSTLDRFAQVRQQTDNDRAGLTGYIDAALGKARNAAESDTGIGARWRAMNELTLQDDASFYIRGAIAALFILLGLLPLFSKMWRGSTIHDKRIIARRTLEILRLNYVLQNERIRLGALLQHEHDLRHQRRRGETTN